jgi:hypothetical protein
MSHLSRTLSSLSHPKITPSPFQKITIFVLITLNFLAGWAVLLVGVNRHWQALPVDTRFPLVLFMVVYPMPWVNYVFHEKLEPYVMALQTYLVLSIATQAMVGLFHVTS